MSDATSWSVQAIGWVSSTRDETIDDDLDSIEATITLHDRFGVDALLGLTEFSHIEVIYLFDRVDSATVNMGARVPRNNPAWPAVGIFAQRAKNRPNRLGLATCQLLGVDGTVVRVRGLDEGDSYEVVEESPGYYLVKTRDRLGLTCLPKFEYAPVPTDQWVDVTSECEFNGLDIVHGRVTVARLQMTSERYTITHPPSSTAPTG